MHLHATDEWNRPRCQQISTYVDVDEDYQCALVAAHVGDCDPLPEIPEDDGRTAAALADDIAALDAYDAAHPVPASHGWADACTYTFVGVDSEGLATFRIA